MAPETLRLRIRSPSAVLISGQAYQEPKDALNEFVSNAPDEYVEAGVRGGRIRVFLRRRGKRAFVAVEDDGRGMDADRLREVAQSLFASRKAGDDRTLGEKAIGILAFQQLGGRCEIVTRTEDSRTASLRLERVAREVDEQQADRLSDTIRRIFGRVLKELDDLDNPMRTLLGREEGEGALGLGADEDHSNTADGADVQRTPTGDLPDLGQSPPTPREPPSTESAAAERGRSRSLPTVAPDPEPGSARSRFDPDSRLVLYNESHPDYLGLKEDEASLLDYLATLVAKEYVVYNNPRSAPEELAEEMVRMLVRVRRQVALVRPARRR